LIDLYTFHFEILERFLDGLLDLLCVCICQGVSMSSGSSPVLTQ
jgi:brefeldin A-inhibited guanine nucleotide-exchange protein